MWQSIHFQPILNQTMMITIFVMAMMVLIEQLNIRTQGLWSHKIRQSPILQIVLAAVLGIIPGCLGAYSLVSLYAHRVVGFAALVSNMIATSGDEAFVMFSLIPHQALLINLILLVVAVVAGIVVHIIVQGRAGTVVQASESFKHDMHLHTEEIQFPKKNWLSKLRYNWKHMSFVRALLLAGCLLFIAAILTNVIAHEHFDIDHLLHSQHQASAANNTDVMHPVHEHHFPWLKITYVLVLGATFLSFLVADEHFLEVHLWQHVLKKHFVKMLLWTFAALLAVELLQTSYQLQSLLSDNKWWVLLLAVGVGLIPQSGPHLLFLILFVQGGLPFSILLANSIVQDGHGALPLLAESRKRFFLLKAINLLVGMLVGTIGLLLTQ